MKGFGNLIISGTLTTLGTGSCFKHDLDVAGYVSASTFCGDGSNLTGIALYTDTDATLLMNSCGVVSGSSQIIGILTSLNSYTQSNDSKWSNLESVSGSFAKTNSTNTFNGNQIISGSLIVTQDFVLLGSASIQHVSSSTLDIGTNLITVAVNQPSIRFGGLSVIDSGSSGGSGSFLYDSVQDEFIFVHRGNGTNITSSHFVLGPETYDNLGNEIYIPQNRLIKGVGNEHIASSNIFDDGVTISFGSNVAVTGSITLSGTVDGVDVSVLNSNINSFSASALTRLNNLEIETANLELFTSSINTTIKTQLNVNTVISSSNQLANTTIPGDLTITGKITAQEFHTELVSASIIYESGSTLFGNSIDDRHIFTGSLEVNANDLFVSGSSVGIGTRTLPKKLNISGDVKIDGKLDLNSSGLSVFIGSDAGRVDNETTNQNVGIGYQSMYSNTNGDGNVAAGYQSLCSNLVGTLNTAIGYVASIRGIGNYNTAVGGYSLCSNTGDCNTAVGTYSLLYITGSGSDCNIGIGFSAGCVISIDNGGGFLNSATSSVFIGSFTRALNQNQTNQIVIGSNAVGEGSNSVVLGNTSITKTVLRANVGIGTTTPSTALEVSGTITATSFVETSTIKKKTNIRDLENVSILDELRPVSFEWIGTNSSDYGFIAEEVELLDNKLTIKDEFGELIGIKYTKIIPFLVKKIQEQDIKIKELEKRLDGNT